MCSCVVPCLCELKLCYMDVLYALYVNVLVCIKVVNVILINNIKK